MKLPEPQTILITGATGSIGAALAQAYAAPHRALDLQGRDLVSLEALTRQCEKRGAEVRTHRVDLADPAQLRTWLQDLQAQSPPDLAIVNAGVTSFVGSGGEGEAWQDVRRVLDVNLNSPVALVEALLPAMRARGSGQIALVSSLSAYFGLPLTPSYCASKAGLKAYGEALRGWLGPQGIAVNVILPGFVASNMSDRFPGPKPSLMSPGRAAAIIRRRLARNPARIAFPIPLSWGMWWLGMLPPDASLWILRHLGYAGTRGPQA
jgi:short-subunit dehydrogenase